MISLCGPGRLVIFSQTVRSRAAVLIFTWWSASLFQGRHTVTTPPALGSLCGKVRMSDVTLSLIWGLPELYYFIKWSPLSESLPPPIYSPSFLTYFGITIQYFAPWMIIGRTTTFWRRWILWVIQFPRELGHLKAYVTQSWKQYFGCAYGIQQSPAALFLTARLSFNVVDEASLTAF